MKQANYETIINVIQYGAPALAGMLIEDLNNTVEQANSYLKIQDEAERERKRKVNEEHAVRETCTGTCVKEND